ncbi:pentatricopeptide repeat-containing protein MRL1, chloroplastic isoform X2 [Euphorbia lathyris]|uniref:pentatricopeptide repeat-containing protein MRL1, chloroplastic isoform X2 n=1 Tax=Euphorbia lathyris TaxID=212925 RepID=UPI0033131DA1
MELCFSPQSIFFASLSSPTPSIRRDFLGCSHNLRPPGGALLPRTKCRRLTIRRSNSPSLVINASFASESVLLFVAVSALSAVSFTYLNHHLNNRSSLKKNSKLALGSLSYQLSRFGRNVVNHIVGSSGSKIGDVHSGINLQVQSQELAEKATENGYVIEAKRTHIQVLENTVTNETSLLVETTESVNADYAVCSAPKHKVSVESEASHLSTQHLASPEPEIVPSLVLASGISELTLENIRNRTEFDSEFPQLIVEESNIASLSTTVEVDEKNDCSGHNGITKESSRDDIYTFYEEKQSTAKSSSKLNGFNAASSLIGNGFPLLKLNGAVKDAQLLKQPSLPTSESVEEEVRVAHFERRLSHKNEKIGKKQFPREKEKRNLTQTDHAKSSELSSPNGIDTTNKEHPSQQAYIYNGLLRDGRLAECVDLLEDMERRGLLDMSKIYHAKFFKICKQKKAVKEAFRFCKLIPNPTLSTFNMLMTVCASSQDSERAFEVLQFAQGAGLRADCKLYTTLISTCAKSGKVDAMFEVFHKMVNAGVEPNVHTYGALIDGCGRAGQMAKAFGAYGILRSKNVKPDRVVFNALISACGQSGAVDRAFDVLAEMGAETQPIDPDHVTVGALIKACAKAGQVDRAKEVYNMMNKYNIKGTPEVYTIAVSCCSQTGDWEFAQCVYDDMTRKGVAPDEMFLSALIDVAGHAGMVDAAFETLREARSQGRQFGIIPYSSLMGACTNAKNWQKALELYDDLKSIKLKPTVSIMNALITALCDGDQLSKAIEVLSEMKCLGLRPNTITYSVLFVASERKNDLDVGCMLLSQVKEDSVTPTLIMYKCIIGMCLRRYEKACAVGEPVLSFDLDQPQLKNEWTNMALSAYRETIAAGEKPTMEVVSQVLGCLRFPYDASLKKRLLENLSATADSSKFSNLCCLVDGFGEYDPRAFSLLEEAASLGTVPSVSFKQSPIVIDAKSLQIHIAEVYLLKTMKGLKHRLAAGSWFCHYF